VRVRARRYVVEEVVAPPGRGDDALVRLSCLDDDAQGETLDVLWAREVDAEVVAPFAFGRTGARGFDAPEIFAAYLRALRWSAVSATDPRRAYAPHRAGIELLPYQLEPLRRALHQPYVRLFVADDVGLGKTIEAALVVRELLLLKRVRRVVVACPPSVVSKWRDELEERFGLAFAVYDRAFVAAKRRERGHGVNPFATHTRFVVSHALLRDDAHAGLLRDWLTTEARPALREPALVVLDEAHHAAPASGPARRGDARFARCMRELLPLFEHRVFLSATPHAGDSGAFAALLEVLDERRFCRGVEVSARDVDAVVVRRIKADLREIGVAFPARRLHRVVIDGLPDDAPELALARLLDAYRSVREARVATAPRRVQAAAELVLTGLQRRLMSSIEAFAATLALHRAAVLRARPAAVLAPAIDLLDAPGADDPRAELEEAEVLADDAERVAIATEAAGAAAAFDARERELLARMAEIADAARARPDARVERLLGWIRERCLEADGSTWNGTRLLVFTEFADTKRWLERALREALAATERGDERVAALDGGLGEERVRELQRAFAAPPDAHPLRVLIATDAVREGIDLQHRCANLVHFDVPWSSSRMEQRNGRIDRLFQPADEVAFWCFVHAQRAEDRVLAALVDKAWRLHAEHGSLPPEVETRLEALLEGGVRHAEAEALARAIAAADADPARRARVAGELERARVQRARLAEQTRELAATAAHAEEALGFDEDAFRSALSAALVVAGASPLEPCRDGDGFELPKSAGALGLPGWAATLDTLRAPRRRGEDVRAFRERAPLRPVVFRAGPSSDGAKVLLHLEHRLVQRLLGRFLAQGVAYDDLARATALLSDVPSPRVVLLGWLSLHGHGAARLHEELLALEAPARRAAPRDAASVDTSAAVLARVEAALRRARTPPRIACDELLASAAADAAELAPALDALARERGARAEELLAARGNAEAAEIREALEAHCARVASRLAEIDAPQLTLRFDAADGDARRADDDRRHLRQRGAELDAELRREPSRILRDYELATRRVDAIGLVYLWPEAH
ncbi:MAG TPA: DISARM system SNF2-like helicase DrmD, partial [Minicystis sp.]|nr:DISARM system SNF2-like helicase DrmD [Minicystis sp.]